MSNNGNNLGLDLSPSSSGEVSEPVKTVIPLSAEEVAFTTRDADTARVRVTTHTESREHRVDVPIIREEVSVQRVAVSRMVDAPPAIRQEGDVLIVPVVEEVLVVEKRLMLREEIHITTHRRQVAEPQSVTLRRQNATVQRIDLNTNNTFPEAADVSNPAVSTGKSSTGK
jgi:uncharacterized protein (TIGR02271 family)